MTEPAKEIAQPEWDKYEVAPGVACLTCGSEAVGVKAHAKGFDYCRSCFYIGRAYADVRADQLAEFRAALPGWAVAVEHTGGGCFWLALTPPDAGGFFYSLTDGEASLPDVEIEGERTPIRGGWGYVGRNHEDEAHPDYEATVVTGAPYIEGDYSPEKHAAYWDEYPAHSMTDADVIAAVLADWEKVRA